MSVPQADVSVIMLERSRLLLAVLRGSIARKRAAVS
jgi:hypothetical protein